MLRYWCCLLVTVVSVVVSLSPVSARNDTAMSSSAIRINTRQASGYGGSGRPHCCFGARFCFSNIILCHYLSSRRSQFGASIIAQQKREKMGEEKRDKEILARSKRNKQSCIGDIFCFYSQPHHFVNKKKRGGHHRQHHNSHPPTLPQAPQAPRHRPRRSLSSQRDRRVSAVCLYDIIKQAAAAAAAAAAEKTQHPQQREITDTDTGHRDIAADEIVPQYNMADADDNDDEITNDEMDEALQVIEEEEEEEVDDNVDEEDIDLFVHGSHVVDKKRCCLGDMFCLHDDFCNRLRRRRPMVRSWQK